ncbi:TPA: hypothetical protein O4I98_001351 [Vibrio parahaemolyticus]|nr:hypothetical protein [Vibrio parahaemolyticus]
MGKCGSIGVAQNNSGIPGDDGVIWKSPSKKRVIAAAPQMEGVSLTIKSISRNANSAIDGNDGFYFIVETSLGSKRIPESGTLSINPGQTMDFSSEDIKITGVPPEHEKLQVLVADNYGSAAWSQFKKTERFGKGERVIQPGIKVWYPPQQPATKPTSRIERQWEVKYEINYRAPQISTNPN